MSRGCRWLAGLTALAVLVPGAAGQVVGPSTGGVAALAQAERMLGHTKRVLLIAAHPDDEDTELLTYLVRHEGAEAAYLSLTRGEGGQNLLGAELGEALGLLRSEELLAARRLDGARQYFTRAFDFGYSKSIEEAFDFWPRDTVLKDVVRIIRRFRPAIVVTTFSGTRRDGHGQHQVAGWVAPEAFHAAGDPSRFPELAREEGLAPWAPSKLYRSARFDTTGTTTVLEGGRLDPEIGQSYRQIAMRGRSLHRSQDMGVLQEIGPSLIRLALVVDRTGGGPVPFAGIDTAPPSTPGIEAMDQARHAMAARAIRAGLLVDAIASAAKLVEAQRVGLRLSIWNAGQHAATGRIELDLPPGWRAQGACLARDVSVPPGTVHHCADTVTVAAGAPVTTPYYLEAERRGALYRWQGDPSRWGEPFDPPLVIARFTMVPAGEAPIVLEREVEHRFRDQAIGEVRRPLAVVPRVDVKVTPEVMVWPLARRGAQPVAVTLQHAGSEPTSGSVHLELPAGWPAVGPQPFRLTRLDERRTFVFDVRPLVSPRPGTDTIRAHARGEGGRRWSTGVSTVSYPHIRERGSTRPSTLLVYAAQVELPSARRIGYVRGASDLVPEALAGIGVPVVELDQATLERGDLAGYDVIVIGSRAYETNRGLVESNGRLLDYVRAGGYLLVQYQQQAFFEGGFAPFPLTMSPPNESRRQQQRVTDELAPVRVLVPADPAFQTPNRIGAADWEGWVQERGLYFAGSWDPSYRPLLETHDPGEPPLRGGLLVARYGKGSYLYTGLAFFRQLPAGVPGAYRLFVNLLDARSRAAVP